MLWGPPTITAKPDRRHETPPHPHPSRPSSGTTVLLAPPLTASLTTHLTPQAPLEKCTCGKGKVLHRGRDKPHRSCQFYLLTGSQAHCSSPSLTMRALYYRWASVPHPSLRPETSGSPGALREVTEGPVTLITFQSHLFPHLFLVHIPHETSGPSFCQSCTFLPGMPTPPRLRG